MCGLGRIAHALDGRSYLTEAYRYRPIIAVTKQFRRKSDKPQPDLGRAFVVRQAQGIVVEFQHAIAIVGSKPAVGWVDCRWPRCPRKNPPGGTTIRSPCARHTAGARCCAGHAAVGRFAARVARRAGAKCVSNQRGAAVFGLWRSMAGGRRFGLRAARVRRDARRARHRSCHHLARVPASAGCEGRARRARWCARGRSIDCHHRGRSHRNGGASACDTASADGTATGEGLPGLVRGFVSGGALSGSARAVHDGFADAQAGVSGVVEINRTDRVFASVLGDYHGNFRSQTFNQASATGTFGYAHGFANHDSPSLSGGRVLSASATQSAASCCPDRWAAKRRC